MKKNTKFSSIVFAGGGTGGHLFPALSIAYYFKKKHPSCKIRFIGSKNGIEYSIIPKENFELYTLPVMGLYRKGLWRKILSLVLIPLSVLHSIFLLLKWKPDFVLGVGSYAAGPFILACILLRQKFFLQEQNAYPGITNKFLGKYADISFLAYPDKYQFFRNPVVVGNPIRPEIQALWHNNQKRDNKKFQISILGGSGGSQIVNRLFLATLPQITQLQKEINILHQSGPRDYEKLQNFYKKSGFNARVQIFIEDMVEIYQNTHLFISRAGAGIFEMMASGRIGILIPIENSSGDHQKENAKKHEKNGGCFLLEENNAKPEKIAEIILDLFKNRKKIIKREKIASNFYQGDASEKIYQNIYTLFSNEKNNN